MNVLVTTTREGSTELINKAIKISEELDIKFIERENCSLEKIIEDSNYDIEYLLVVERDRLILKGKDSDLFWHPNMAELKIKSIKNSNKESVMEAMKLQSGDSVLDCTLGLAGDSIIFSAMVGAEGKVVGTEVNKYIAYLTKDGLKNYKNVAEETKRAMDRIEVINSSYKDFLEKQKDNSFDIVYFDPMFKKANKKSTSINSFRNFADHSGLSKDIINEALRVCRKRVVIKERQGNNDFEKLGIEKVYGSKKNGAIIYGVIEK